MAALAVWSTEIKPGKDFTFNPRTSVRITNAALGEKLENESARSTLKLTYQQPMLADSEAEDDDDEDNENAGFEEKSTVLCSLTPGKIEQCIMDIVLVDDIEYIIANSGKNTIYLSGNYIDNDMDEEPDSDEELDEDDDPAVYLDEVSSDVAVDPNDVDMLDDDDSDDENRFEEVDEAKEKSEKPPTLKRPRDEDSAEAQGDKKLSKKQLKKLNKKQKAENGDAVPAGSESSSPAKSEKPGSEKAAKANKEGEGKKDKKYKDLPGGLKIRDGKKKGEGPQAKKGDKIKMRYIGKLSDGKIFDSNTNGKPFVFTLGKGEVIKGWDEGIVGMCVGGERELVIPPEMAYGKRGQGTTIPPSATLRFECKLLALN